MKQIINLFRHNALKKLLALVAAFCMWVYVMADQDPPIEESYNVPLIISNAPHGFIALYDSKNINVVTRAPRSNFVKYNANAFRVYANVEGLGEGDHQITPKVDMPQGFELVETHPSMDIVTVVGPKSYVEQIVKVYGIVNLTGNSSSFEVQIPMNAVDANGNSLPSVHVVPSVITVSVDLESGVKKKIVPIIHGLIPAEGWALTGVTVEPEQTEISGTESAVNAVVMLKTLPFTVQTGQRLFKGKLKLDVPEGITVKDEEVTVSAEVIRKPVMRDN